MQWQHGSYTKNANGSLSLEPIAVDGRQLLSSPCEFSHAVFTRYHQPELIKVRQSLLWVGVRETTAESLP